jgi:5-methylcytosine-specific restriction endonuclease McrA
MDKEEIQKLFNQSPAECEYSENWCRFLNSAEMEVTFRKESKEFREFWREKILNDSYPELSEADMNRVILFFDSTAKGSKEFRESGGVSAALANIHMTQWYRVLQSLKHNEEIREGLNQILIEENDDVVIDLIDKLERINPKNGLTGAGTVILSAILCVYDPDRYLTMLLLSHRLALINFFGISYVHSYRTYGEKIVKTKNDIIFGFKNNFGIDTTPYQLSFFVYCKLRGKYHWLSNIKNQINVPEDSAIHSVIDELESAVAFQRERIPDKIKHEVWRRDNGKCAQCGSREKLEYDHIIPISKGGSSTTRNIELLCESCNRKKSNKI